MSDATYVVGAGPFFPFKPILYVLIALKPFSDVQANNDVICAGKTPTWYVQSNFFSFDATLHALIALKPLSHVQANIFLCAPVHILHDE
jgi:hypothetical protein